MDVTKEEFLSWKGDKVTQVVFKMLEERREAAKDILSRSAGMEPANDRLLVGMIQAFNEVLEVQYEIYSDNASDSDSPED